MVNEKKSKETKEGFTPIREAEALTGIGQQTLRKLYDEGVIGGYKTPAGQRMFSRRALSDFCGSTNINEADRVGKANFIYTRVSSKKQSDDLDRQVKYLQSIKQEYNDYSLIKDIGSGINFKRKGLNEILDRCTQNTIGEVVVAHKDRLSRFGFDLIKIIIEKAGGTLTVINDTGNVSSEQELAEDLLSIVHIYSCRQMGKRSYSKRKDTGSEDVFGETTQANDESEENN